MEDQNLTKRQIQALNTKNKIYETAIELIVTEGYDNVTLGAICKKAGVSIGGFYHHFQSKYDIIVEGFKNGDKYIEQQIYDYFKKNHNSLDTIVELIRLEMNYAKEIGIDFVRQMFKNEIQVENKFLTSEEHLFNGIIKNIVMTGQQRNEIRTDMTIDEITNYIIRFSRGIIYDWCLHDGKFDIVDFSDKAFKRFMKMFEPNLSHKNNG